jgi:hypothetical protein
MKIVWKKREETKRPVPFYNDEFFKDGPSDIAMTVIMLLFFLVIALLVFYSNRYLH